MDAYPYKVRQDAMLKAFDAALHAANGIHLLDAPTGSGKTHCLADAISNIDWQTFNRKVVIVTPSKVNRDDFMVAVARALDVDVDSYRICNITSNWDSILRAIESGLPLPIPDTPIEGFEDKDKKIRDLLDGIKRLLVDEKKLKSFGSLDDATTKYLEEQKKEFDRDLRRSVSSYIKAACEMKNEMLRDNMMNGVDLPQFMLTPREGFSGIAQWWPAARMAMANVIIMTPERFLYPVDTIITGNISMTSPAILQNCVLVLDESDQVKDNWTQVLIKRATEMNARCDMFALVRDLASMNDAKPILPSAMCRALDYENPKQPEKGQHDDKVEEPKPDSYDAKTGIATIYDLADTLSNELKLKFSMYTEDIDLMGPAYVFGGSTSCVRWNQTTLRYQPDENQYQNLVYSKKVESESPETETKTSKASKPVKKASTEQKQKEEVDAGDSLSLIEASRRLSGGVKVMVTKLLKPAAAKVHAHFKQIDALYTAENAVRSLLNALRFPEKVAMTRMVVDSFSTLTLDSLDSEGQLPDRSVYATGVEVLSLENSPNHVQMTEIMSYRLDATVEAMLLYMAAVCPIIMVSATAAIETVKNYDFEYLGHAKDFDVQWAGGDALHELIVESTEMYNERCKDLYNIDIALYDQPEYKEDGAETATTALERKTRQVASQLKGFAEAVAAGHARAGVAFNPFMLKDRDAQLQAVASMKTVEGAPDDIEVFFLNAEKWGTGDGFAAFEEHVAKGSPAIIVTTYASAGYGKNLQVDVSGNDSLVTLETGFEIHQDKRDLDFIALSDPTNALISVNKEARGDIEQLLAGVLQQAELRERGEITRKEASLRIRRLIENHRHDKTSGFKSKQLPSSRATKARILNQALGRISRTYVKPKNLTVMVSTEALECTDFYALEDSPVTYEWQALCDFALTWQQENIERIKLSDTDPLAQHNEQANANGWSRIRRNLHRDESGAHLASQIEDWSARREWLMKNPTITDNPKGTEYQYRIDTEGDKILKYWYARQKVGDNDFGEVEISFSGPIDVSMREDWHAGEVSEEDSRITAVAVIPELAEFFTQRGYRLSWEPARYLMTPIEENNIYKGKIGEAVLECFIEHWVSEITLDPLEDDGAEHEMFDYKIVGTDIYLDAKNYAPREFGGKIEPEKVLGKMDKVGARIAIIANAFTNPDAGLHPTTWGNGRFITIPGLYNMATNSVNPQAIAAIRKVLKNEATR